jgi:transcription antitermination factor NusG
MGSNWYALRSKPRKEDSVWRQVHAQGIDAYYPRMRVNPVNPRSRKFKPYFPGYLFVNVELESVGLSTFQWMPHTLGLVSFGGEPAIVPENLIDAIRKRIEEINAAGGLELEGLVPGEVVRITDGPFQGYEAIFDASLPGAARVRVLLELLGNKRQVQLELSAGQIVRKRQKITKKDKIQ